jgi:hypothetical protein
MAAAGGDFQCATSTLLPDNIAQIRVIVSCAEDTRPGWSNFFAAVEVGAERQYIGRCNNLAVGDMGGEGSARGGDHQLTPGARCRTSCSYYTRDRANAAIQRQFAQEFVLREVIGWYLSGCT